MKYLLKVPLAALELVLGLLNGILGGLLDPFFESTDTPQRNPLSINR